MVKGNQIYIMRGTDAVIPIKRRNGTFESGSKVIFDMAKTTSGANILHKEITTFTEEGTTATLVIDAADTTALATGKYVYNLIYQDANGKKAPLVHPSVFDITERVPQ